MNDGDDYDFTPSASSNLRSLFDNSVESLDISSLIYTAPKQPKTSTSTESKSEAQSKPESMVICAKIVHVWKLENGKYVALGKLGCALIGSSQQNLFEIILYKERKNVIIRAKITQTFEIVLKKDNFLSFYDSNNCNWLVKFASETDNKDIVENLKKIGTKIIEDVSPQKSEKSSLNENKARTDILSRIAKMGQSILPNNPELEDNIYEIRTESLLQTQTVCAPSREDKLDSITQTRQLSNPQSFFNDFAQKENQLKPISQNNKVFLTQNKENQLEPVAQTSQNTFISNFDPFSFLVAENRAQSSEIKLNLSQINEKLNSVLGLVDGRTNSDTNNSRIKVLELRIENLLKEMDYLKEENQKNVNNFELEKQIAEYKTKVDELLNLVEFKDKEVKELKRESKEKEFTFKEETLKLEEEVKNLENKLSQELEKIEKISNKKENFEKILKEKMNELFANISQNFSQESNIPVAKNIKQITMEIMEKFEAIFDLK